MICKLTQRMARRQCILKLPHTMNLISSPFTNPPSYWTLEVLHNSKHFCFTFFFLRDVQTSKVLSFISRSPLLLYLPNKHTVVKWVKPPQAAESCVCVCVFTWCQPKLGPAWRRKVPIWSNRMGYSAWEGLSWLGDK
jgi:hypothetical protein